MSAAGDAAAAAAREFAIEGELAQLEPYERGHIHDTFLSSWHRNGTNARYLHQRINDRVFADVPGLMHNVEQVTGHLARRLATRGAPEGLCTLALVPTRRGRAWLRADSGAWRTYEFVEGTRSFDRCEGPQQAYEAARAFGDFQALLEDLDARALRDTIPRFFSAPYRMRQLEDALESDPLGRAEGAAPELQFALDRRPLVGRIESRLRAGAFPSRVVHGDTKLNNILFDRHGQRAVCVVDLDTCMPAWSLYDFGDLVRFTAATSDEDETDLERAGIDLELYHALVEGYLDGTAGLLTPEEVTLMPFAARLVTLMIGLRFLADHLAGDVYFKTSRQGQNLDRARVQLRMVAAMEERASEMATRRTR